MDGYVLGIIAISLSVMNQQMEMSATMSGLVGMGTLMGMFIGSLIGGYITDIIGRKKMFSLDFMYIVIISVVSFFAGTPEIVFICRILIGIGLGADYPIAGPYLAEFTPKKSRGSIVGALNAFWYLGYASSFIVGYFLLALGDDSWKWMLFSSAVPAFIWLLARAVMPESPRWLLSKGREAEAATVLKKIGDNVVLGEDEEPEEKTSFRDIFKGGYGKWVFFVAAFWSLQVVPTFGIGTYVPTIMEQLGFSEGNMQYLGSALMNAFYLLGLIPVFFLIETLGRRTTIIWPFFVSGAALIILGVTSGMHMSFAFVLILFIVYGAFNVAMGAHDWIYPNELFPTRIRGTAMGFITAMTRIVAAAGTFLFPLIMEKFGLASTLYICGGLFFAGFILCVAMAPETKNMKLADTAALAGGPR
jgi:putative MFS transporter